MKGIKGGGNNRTSKINKSKIMDKVNSKIKFFDSLRKVQGKIKAEKSEKNKFGNYTYRNAENILSEVKPLLLELKLFMSINDEVYETTQGKLYIRATVQITDGENYIESSALAQEPEKLGSMSPSQLTGTASSYARKYALGAMFLLSGEACPDYATDLNSQKTIQDKDKDKDKLQKAIDKLGYMKVHSDKAGLKEETLIPCQMYVGKKIKDLNIKTYDWMMRYADEIFTDHPNFKQALEDAYAVFKK